MKQNKDVSNAGAEGYCVQWFDKDGTPRVRYFGNVQEAITFASHSNNCACKVCKPKD